MARGTLLCLLIVAGGETLFLILAPLVGYIPYGDRPQPGFHPITGPITWSAFGSFALDQLGYGFYFLIMTAPGALLCAIVIRALELIPDRPRLVRTVGGVVCAIVTGFSMLIVSGTINMAFPPWLFSVVLGALAGAWAMPRRRAAPAVPAAA